LKFPGRCVAAKPSVEVPTRHQAASSSPRRSCLLFFRPLSLQGLYYLDSGALAALLKELNKSGHSRRAQELFDWLRGLDPTHDLYALANTMTYTTMISQCGTQQQVRRRRWVGWWHGGRGGY
jgi:hypothetical protein